MTTGKDTRTVDPVRVYVLWHQSSTQGKHFAKAIYHWFRGSPGDLTETGYGIPVHYRSLVEAGEPNLDPYDFRCNGDLKPTPIKWEKAGLNIVVPLLDEHMVTHAGWRCYLEDIARSAADNTGSAPTITTLPVKLHPSAHNVPGELAAQNYIRIDSEDDPAHLQWNEKLAVRTERLLSRLTQAVCKQLETQLRSQTGRADTADANELRVFISHAKADGTQIATAVRDALLRAGQVDVFFDEHHLPYGERHEPRLDSAAGSTGTSAMIAVYTDAYAGRQWCQRELRAARTPFPLEVSTSQEAPRYSRWTHKPLIILDALHQTRTRYLGEVGQAPVIRWNKSRVSAIVDLLLRETMLSAYQRLWACRLPLKDTEETSAFAGYLDLHVARHIGNENGRLRQLVVPPPGPPIADRTWLERLLPEIEIQTFSEFEIAHQQESGNRSERPRESRNSKTDRGPQPRVIGVSISDSPDLERLGFGVEHLHEIMLSVARMLLRSGTEAHPIHLAYGGDLRPGGFTQTLFDLAQSEGQGDWQGRMYSYIAWPYYLDLSESDEAQLISSCDFLRITPKDSGFADTPASTRPSDRHEASPQAVTARCISTLREQMTSGGKVTLDGKEVQGLTARLIFGGKRVGYTGVMPGIFEEFMLAEEHGVPVYIMGGFGGAAGDLAKAVLDSQALDEVFTWEYQKTRTHGLAALDAGDAYAKLEKSINRYREAIANGNSPNGLTVEQNEVLQDSTCMAEIVGLILRGIEEATGK